MTKVSLLALLAVVALVLFPAIAFAQGIPPCAFHGTVQVNGQNVADGTVIRATIGSTTYTTTTPTKSGNSTYRIVIAQPQGKSYDGMTVTFMIGNATAGQTGTWQMGGNVALNLTLPYPQCAFHGTVQVNGQNVADGTAIGATIGNDTYTTTTGNSTYRIVIDEPKGKSYYGLTVTFMIGNATASQTRTWQRGGNVALNLTLPYPPCAFHGTVQVNGQNVGNGTVITATIGNDTYTTTTGNSTYGIVIAEPEGKSYGGLTVTFMIGTGQTGTWQMGGNVALNLTVSTPTPTPTLTPTPTPAGKTNVWVIVGSIIAVIVIGLVEYWFFSRRRTPPTPTGGSTDPQH